MRNGGRTNTPDRVLHAVGMVMIALIVFGLWFGREVIVVILWAVFS
jgi:hypothetical protein